MAVSTQSAPEAKPFIVRRAQAGIALAALSFVIYACLALSLPQIRNARSCCEQSSLASAVSNVLYGTRLGSYYSGVFDSFMAHFSQPLSSTLEGLRAELPAKPTGAWIPTTRDGNGVGYPVVATAALRLFGIHARAPVLLMLILMAVSAAAFLHCFFRRYTAVVVLYFAALAAMLFTPLVWDPSWAVQIPVGGIRYFSLVSVLPVFHILLTLLDRQSPDPHAGWRGAVPLGIQTAILVIATLVRGSAIPLIGAIALAGLVMAWRYRRDRGRLLSLARSFAVMGLVSLGLLVSIMLSVPRQYLTDGRFGTVVWQRVVQSLGASPAFPFPGINDMFECPDLLPHGLLAGMPDENGMCIWLDYAARHNVPPDAHAYLVFGNVFETALREAFFRIAARYPREVLETFLYYKFQYIARSIDLSVRFNFAGDPTRALLPTGPAVLPYPAPAIGLLILSIGIVGAYFSIATVSMSDVWRIAEVGLLAALFTIPSYMAAWAMPHTSADLLLYCFFSIGLILGTIVLGIRRAVRGALGHA